MSRQFRICFVCLGNIVRSPLAESLFQRYVREAGLEDRYTAHSAGTASYHVGETPDPRMLQVASRFGHKYTHNACQFGRGDLDHCDLILAMDNENLADLRRMASTPAQREKIHLLREFDPQGGPGAPVPDPYYGGIEGFTEVYQVIDRSVRGLLDALENGWFGDK